MQINNTAIKDPANNAYAGISDPMAWSFTTDYTPPVLAVSAPFAGAGNVPVTANLVATFDEPIGAGSGNITIKNLTDAT